MDQALNRILSFIESPSFFYYHGFVLALVWFFGSNVAILARKVSLTIHGLCFFVLDLITAFFLSGAWIRIYPHIDTITTWSPLKIAHIIGGSTFALLLMIQHIGGATTLLKGIKKNPEHRKFGFVVANTARFICVFGFLLAGKDQIAQYLVFIAIVLLAVSFYLTFKTQKQQVTERPKKV